MVYSSSELDLLHSWCEKAAGWRWLHYESMAFYKSINSKFVYASIFLSTLASAGGFSTAGQSHGDNSVIGSMQIYMGYIIGATNVVIGLLNSFQRFGKAAEKTELHSSAAMQYAMINRQLETELSLSQEHMKQDLITTVRHDMDKLLSQSPMIPMIIILKFNENFPDLQNKPDVCSDFGGPKIEKSKLKIITKLIKTSMYKDQSPNSSLKSSPTRESLDLQNRESLETPARQLKPLKEFDIGNVELV